MPPMYWQGYYAPSGGLPHLQQPSLLRPPPGLPMPHSMQHPFQYPGMNPSLPSGSQTLPELPLFPHASSNTTLTSSPLPSVLDPSSTSTLSMETSSTLLPNKSPVTTSPVSTFSVSLPLVPPLTSNLEKTVAMPQSTPVVSSKPSAVPGSTLAYLSVSEPVPSSVVSSSSSQVEKPVALVMPGKLLQTGPSVLPSSQPLQTSRMDADAKALEDKSKPLLPEPSLTAAVEAKEPILPLPKSTIQKYSRPATKFTEDFDFMAMNEKFNKDEVWGHIGKNKSHVRDKDGELQEDETDDYLDEDEEALKHEVKVVKSIEQVEVVGVAFEEVGVDEGPTMEGAMDTSVGAVVMVTHIVLLRLEASRINAGASVLLLA
ncbi:hypothetical protein B296_00026605 [Ensete ventricosum]|uniref:DFDF domain-containing protein n=1 Tax=Ensete ventricosum TaxID=4639 RepID=A0A427AHD9_ENSVE|nr:hypothetical protein B296_00026605 [Ensete ventricosum]